MSKKYILEECTEQEFIEVNGEKYIYPNDKLYSGNIGKNLTDGRILKLYEWKNGMKLSPLKRVSVENNYPKGYGEELETRYLNPKKPGGSIWNIFYLHINDPEKWPIFDQHVYRAMCHIKTAEVQELPKNKRKIYKIYIGEYIPFFKRFREKSYRKKDKALFAYGKSLKEKCIS